MNNTKWAPVSSTAYGANAVYIPEFGKARTLEFILVMVQNYPEYKTHPALDVFHGYTKGAERFEENHEMRVLGWAIKPDQPQWSFLYLPTMRNDIRAEVTFSAHDTGRMRMEINMDNPSGENRQWEFHLYINPCEGLELPGFERKILTENKCNFGLNGVNMELRSEGINFRELTETDSNFWINFPLNAECSEDPCNPQNRYKKRLKLVTKWVDIPAGEKRRATIDFLPGGQENNALPAEFVSSYIPDNELPYMHMLWETYHNQQYTRDFNSESMIIRHLPARQWGKFFIWDCGMTAVGMADFDEYYTDKIISEMPDPDICGEETFKQGSYIITATYALWELFRRTGNKDYLAKHYNKMKRLVTHMFDTLPGENYGGMAAAIRGTGADDSPALFYAKGEIFAWDYKKTLPANPEHKKKTLICIGMTAHALRELKILRVFASLLGKQGDVENLTAQIESVEHELNSNYWSDKYQCYLDRLATDDKLLEIPWIYNLLPLFSDSAPEDRKKILFEKLMRTNEYLVENGLMIIPPDSPYYRRDGYPNGSIWPPLQYLFWKACIGMGEMDAARMLAEKYFKVFEENHSETLCCWEQFRAETGRGAGNSRFSGFVTPIIAMWHAHRKAGAVQTGYDIIIESCCISKDHAEFRLQSSFFSGKTGLSVVMKPATMYNLCVDGVDLGELTSDDHGWLGIDLNIKSNTSVLLKLKKM
jgi:hypothetical protein